MLHAIAALILCTGAAVAQPVKLPPAQEAPRTPELATAHALGSAFADLAEQVAPATVHIEVRKVRPLSTGMEQLLRDYGLPSPPDTSTGGGTSTGSGVIVSPGGRVVTNHHVVGGATRTTVTLHDKRSYEARLVGSDPRTDVAVLQIEGEGPFPWVKFGDSDRLRVGEWVVALGHPFDFQFTVTAGIVSARGRRNLARDEIQDYIQTDAAVNPGSSGGPLFNLDGEIIGINTAIFNPGAVAANAGISFAIPANMVQRVLGELAETGRVARGGLGLVTKDRPATPENPRPGAEITRVVPEGPAERAGLRRGDVITAVGGEPVGGSNDLRGIVLATAIQTDLTLSLERGDELLTLPVRTRDDRDLGQTDFTLPEGAVEWGGLILTPVTEDLAARFGNAPPEREHPGLIVLSVAPASPGAAAGLLPGDILLQVQGGDLPSVEALWERVKGRRSATVGFWRNGGENLAILGGLERRDGAPPKGQPQR